MGNLESYLSGLPESDQERGKLFELHSARWLKEDSIWGSQVQQVWGWAEWPQRWNRDAGIDLVAELKDGTLWAIQNKCFAPHRTITKSDIDTFLSESSRKVFHGRIIMSTTNHLSSTLKKTLDGQEKPVKLVLGSDLIESNVDWAKYLSDKKLTKPGKPRKLRTYQTRAIKETTAKFGKANRGQLIMACGTGKTFTALRISESLGSRVTVVCVPSLTLLSQSLRGWLADRQEGFSWLAVCSDESVTKDDSETKTRLIDFSFPSTTNPNTIAKFLSGSGRKVIFTTYQSSSRVAEALQYSGVKVDLLIADEAHRIAGNTDQSMLHLVTDNPDLKIHRRLFLTATPRVFSPATKRSAEVAGAELISMDDKNFFGEVFFNYSFGEAIEDGWLTNYRVAIVLVSEKSVAGDLDDNQIYKTTNKLFSSKVLATHVALDQAMSTYSLRRLISFHSSIERAKQFATDHGVLFSGGPLKKTKKYKLLTDTVTGTQPTSERVESLSKFTQLRDDEALLVTNARCLTEGVDVPSLDGVVFADPRSSRIDIVQAVGRAIRLGDPDKNFGTIVLPVFVEQHESADEELAKSEYRRVWEVITSLESHDPNLASEMAQLREALGRGKNVAKLPSQISILHGKDLPPGFVDALSVGIVRHSASSWDENYGKLLKWVEETGTSRVPQKVGRNSDRISLGVWVQKQRSDFSAEKLSAARISKLESLEGWEWDPIEADWLMNIEALERAATKFGGFLQIPGGYIDEDGNRVYQWTNSLLSSQRYGKISLDKRRRLEAIPYFSTNRREAAWNWGLISAKKWLRASIELPGPTVLIEETGNSLRNWFIVALRTDKILKPSQIEAQRIAAIRNLPHWEKFASRGIGQSRTFIFFDCKGKCFKHFKVNKSDSTCNSVQVSYQDSDLSTIRPESVRTLSSYLQGLELYSAAYGHCVHPLTVDRKPYKYEEHSLGSVKNGYRTRRDKLEPALKKILEEIPGWVWVDDDNRWIEAFKLLQRYADANGTSSVKQGIVFEDYELGNWVARQRRRFKRANNRSGLSDSEKQQLESLPGWTWDASENRSTSARDQAWENSYRALAKFVEREKTVKIPPSHQEDGIYLSRWVTKQRQLYRGTAKAGLLRTDEIKRLEAIQGWRW